MTVFIVRACSDDVEWIEAVYTTKELAVKHIDTRASLKQRHIHERRLDEFDVEDSVAPKWAEK